MNYIDSNKQAWEEAFDLRAPDWGIDIVERVQKEQYPFFEEDMVCVLKKYDFSGKVLAQFCCNNGRELLSLVNTTQAQQGWGFDIAENQVAFANEKAKELNLPCTFQAVNILSLGADFHNSFDALIITIGALCWFKDLDAFFGKVSACLKDKGVLLINEQHPITNMFGLPGEENYIPEHPTCLVNSYFSKEWIGNEGMFYMTQKRYLSKTFTDYSHPLSEILTTMSRAGLRINAMQEFDYDISGSFSDLSHKQIPLSYIIEAQKG
jgi:SAM-dependent methyltransferase